MKRLLLILLICLSICGVASADEQEMISSFKELTSSIMNPIVASYNGNHYSVTNSMYGWGKYMLNPPKYTIDVKKTDSLMNPYIGTLEISNSHTYYHGLFSTKEEAENNDEIDEIRPFMHNLYTYYYQDGTWVLSKVEYSFNGHWEETKLEATPAKIFTCTDDIHK